MNIDERQANQKTNLIQQWSSVSGRHSIKKLSVLAIAMGVYTTSIATALANDTEVTEQIAAVNLQAISVGGQSASVSSSLNGELEEQNKQPENHSEQLTERSVSLLKSLDKKIDTMQLLAKDNPLKTREQVIANHKNGKLAPQYLIQNQPGDAQANVPKEFSNPIYHEFSIYEASSRLFVDDDGDGFYQTFSVTFDADVYGPDAVEVADVYAELYLSRNGGPWIHYYSTDTFTIVGDATNDDFEVLTTLHSGYYTDHYDVLIDLYEVGFDDIVATISSDDTDNLYALPLESSDRDRVYSGGDSSSDGHGGGAMSFLSLLLLVGVGLKRRWQ